MTTLATSKSKAIDCHDADRPPVRWLTLSEPLRLAAELMETAFRLPQLAAAPRGDGHVVLVLPGFLTSDLSTLWLRNYLNFFGYQSRAWGLGFNTGFSSLGDDGSALLGRLTDAFAVQGRKVSLIGWSLGGIMSRRLAREHSHLVRQVISVGSPFTGNPKAVAIRRLYELVSGEVTDTRDAQVRFNRDKAAPEVPTAAIWSRSDGITNWRNCREEAGSHITNVEVRGSHLGLSHNAGVLLAVANLLADQHERARDD